MKDKNGEWLMRSIPNKFPALMPKENLNQRQVGPFKTMDGVGFHEVVFPKKHQGDLAQFSKQEILRLLNAYQRRYLSLMKKKHIRYISIFHNHGEEAGASIDHPHSQIIATPVVDPDIASSIRGSREYYNKNQRCIYCTLIDWQLEQKERLLYKNDDFVVFVPYVTRVPFEVRIYPLEHQPFFEHITKPAKKNLVKAFEQTFKRLDQALDDPPYNMFLHTAPCDGQDYGYYHYHFEIMPRLNIWAGFELGAEMEICSVSPEEAARKLKAVSL